LVGASKSPRVGEILAAKYELEGVLGTGAMGVVVAARHIVLDERVAIKFLLPEVLDDPAAMARFMREAQASAKIKSEHVARVTDVGTCEDGTPFMVMEYLEGEDLNAWLKSHGPLPATQAVEFVLQACEAIAEAHALGIVHRDLKPSNLFCVRRPDGGLAIKVLDFGISKLIGPEYPNAAPSMTDASDLMGSPMYMSPEQLQSTRDVDNRTDIWSMGIILFELMTGKSPFAGESLTAVVLNIAAQPPQSVRELRREIPVGLDAIIDKCLRKDRTERYSTVGELALALARYGSKRAQASVERVLGIIESASSIANPASLSHTLQGFGGPSAGQPKVTRELTASKARRAKLWLLLGFLGFFAALGLAMLARTQSHGAAARGRSVTANTIVVAARAPLSRTPPAPVSTAFTANVPRSAPEAKPFIASAIALVTPSAAKNKHDKSSIRDANVADPRSKRPVTTSQSKSSTQTKPPASPSSTLRMRSAVQAGRSGS
jgi:eukaryotic-like serine/threonine-protein kinase